MYYSLLLFLLEILSKSSMVVSTSVSIDFQKKLFSKQTFLLFIHLISKKHYLRVLEGNFMWVTRSFVLLQEWWYTWKVGFFSIQYRRLLSRRGRRWDICGVIGQRKLILIGIFLTGLRIYVVIVRIRLRLVVPFSGLHFAAVAHFPEGEVEIVAVEAYPITLPLAVRLRKQTIVFFYWGREFFHLKFINLNRYLVTNSWDRLKLDLSVN